MGDSERTHQTVPGNGKRPSSASRHGVTPGFDDEQDILSRLDSIVRTADGSGRSTPAVSERAFLGTGRDSVRQTPDGLDPMRQTPAGSKLVMQTPEGRDSARQTPEIRNSVKESADGRDSARQTPDGRDYARQTPDGRNSARQTPDGRNSARQTPDGRDSARQTPDARNSVRETPDGGNSFQQIPEGGYSSRQTPDGGNSFRQVPDGGYSARQTPDGRTSDWQSADMGDSARQTPDGRYAVSQTPDGGNSVRETPDGRSSARQTPEAGSSFRQTPDGRDSARQTPDFANAIGARDLEKVIQGSGRLTPANKVTAEELVRGVAARQTPEPVAVERQASHRELQPERGTFGAQESGRSSPALTNRSVVAMGPVSARQTPIPAAVEKPEGMLSSVKSIVSSFESGVKDGAERPSQPAKASLEFGDVQTGLSMNNPMFDSEEIEDVEVSSPKPGAVKGFSGDTPRTPVETPGRRIADRTSGGGVANTTPLPSGRANGTPWSGSPQVTSASLQSDEEVFSRLDSIVRSVGEPSSAAQSRPGSARMGPREEPIESDEMEEEIQSEAEEEWTSQKATAGAGRGRPTSAAPSKKSPQLSARSEKSAASSRPSSASKPADATTEAHPSQSRPSADVTRRSNDVTPRQGREDSWSPPVVRRPSGALGNYAPADEYADDDFEGGAEEEIVEDDGPETPEDQAPPRVLNRSVQEIPRENPDGSGSEAALPVRNFGPRPASAYGPRGTSSSAGNVPRNWGASPSDASTSGSRDEGPGQGVESEGAGRGGVVTSSAFANGFDNRPWSAGSAPGMGLHSGSLDGDFDRRSVDLGPVRLAKTGSFGSRGGSRGSGMSKDEFRVHFENAEPAVRCLFPVMFFVLIIELCAQNLMMGRVQGGP